MSRSVKRPRISGKWDALKMDVESDLSSLVTCSDDDFDYAIAKLDIRGLISLVSRLQNEMATEQKRFDELSRRLENGHLNVNAHQYTTAALCASQARLALLCARNMKCFTQQAVKAKQEQASVLGSRPLSARESEASKCHRNGFRDNLLFFELQSKMSASNHDSASPSKSPRTSLSTQHRRSLMMPSLSCSSPNLSESSDSPVNGITEADVTSRNGPFTVVCRVGKDPSEAPRLNGFHSLPRSHARYHDDGEVEANTNDSVRFYASTLPLSRRVRSLGDGLDDDEEDGGSKPSGRVQRVPSVEEILQNVKDLRMRQTDASPIGTTGVLKTNSNASDLSSKDSPMYENVIPRKLEPIYQNVPVDKNPIYQNVRSEEPLYDVPRRLDTPLQVQSPNLSSLKNESIVPTATQLILQARMKGGETNNNGYDGDDILSDCDRDSLEDESQLPPQIPSPDYGSDEDDAAYGVYEDYMNDYPDSGLGESDGRSAYYLEDQALEVIVEEEEEDLEDEDYNSGRSDDKGSSLEYSSLGLITTRNFHNNDINKDDISSDDSIYQKGSNGEAKRQDGRNHIRHSSAVSCPDKFDLPDSAVDIDDLSSIDGPITSPDPTGYSDGSQLLSPEEGVYSDNNLTTSPEGSQEMESNSRTMSPGLQAFQNDEKAVEQAMIEERLSNHPVNGNHLSLSNFDNSFQNSRQFSKEYRTVETSKISSINDLEKTTNKHKSHDLYKKRKDDDDEPAEDVKHALPSVKALRNQFEVNQNGNSVSAPTFPRNTGTLPGRRTKKISDRTSSWNGQDVPTNGTTTKFEKGENVSHTLPIRRSRSIVSQSDKTFPELINSLENERVNSNTLPKSSHTKTKNYYETMNGAVRTAKPIFSPEPPTSPDDVIPSIIAQFGNVVEVGDYSRSSSSLHQWDPTDLLQKLYEVQSPQPTYSADVTSSFINIEGYLDKLPSGRKKATFWNAWKRRFFRIKDGYLYYYQSNTTDKPSLTLNLMGGHIDSMDTTMLGIDDGKGHYVVIRCSNRQEMEQWKAALQTHTVENFNLTYTQPVPAYPHFYEDVIIIDLGSCSVRAGILCNQPTLPQLFFPSVCSIQRETGRHVYGIEALMPSNRANANIVFPLRPSAKITKYSVDLEAVAGLLVKVFTDLNVDPKKYQVQLSLPRSFTVRTQTEVLRLLFDQFHVRSVNLTTQTVLSLLSYNATSGIVVDIGERMDVIPIIDGYVVEPGVSRIPYGGARVIDHLRHFLLQRHYNLVSDIDSYLVRYVLEQMCYCAEKYNEELQKFFTDPESIEMSLSIKEFFSEPPWDEITLDNGRFQAPEGLFNPDAWGLDNPGIHKLVHKAVQECSLDIRKEMTRSIYLSGGLTLIPGFAARLEMEVNKLTPPSLTPKVHGSPYRYHAAYLGACILAGSPGFQEAKITANDWAQNGVNCLRKWHL